MPVGIQDYKQMTVKGGNINVHLFKKHDCFREAPMIRIIGYGRESTREQAEDGFNLDEQERKIQEYVDVYYEGKDIQFTMFREEGVSARSLKRPKMKMILDEIQGGAVDVLIVHNLDRLTRKLVDMEWLVELFEKMNVELISLKEHVDTSTPQGRFFVSIMILIDPKQLYIRSIGKHVSIVIVVEITEPVDIDLRASSVLKKRDLIIHTLFFKELYCLIKGINLLDNRHSILCQLFHSV